MMFAEFHHPDPSQRPVPALYQICSVESANSARCLGSVTESYTLCAATLGIKGALRSSDCIKNEVYMMVTKVMLWSTVAEVTSDVE